MKLTYDELNIMLKKTRDTRLRNNVLRRIFSYKENIDIFAYYFFPNACTAKSPAFHKEIYEFMFAPGDGAMAAPRGHAKSTVVGLFYLTWLIVNKQERYIGYISSDYDKTVQFIEPIRDAFKGNDRLKSVYNVDLTNTKDDKGRDRENCVDVLGCRVEAASFEKNMRGFRYSKDGFIKRPTLLIGDDIEKDERVINPDLRLKDRHRLNKVIIPSLDPEKGRFKMIGTILHWDCLLINKIRLYNGKIFKACTPEFKDIIWSDYWTEERLRAKKRSIGSVAFASEFLNDPLESGASLIKGDWVRRCFDETKSYTDNKTTNTQRYDNTYLGCDFAFGDRVTNDKSAFVGIGVNDGHYDITGIDTYKGLSVTEQFEIIKDMHLKHDYSEIVMEENSIKSMSKNLFEYEFPYYLIWTGATDTAAKRKSDADFVDKRHTVGKKAMILRLATQFENQTITIPYKTERDKEISHRLLEELTTFALNDGKLVEVGIHADIPIGLAMALERASEGGTIIDW